MAFSSHERPNSGFTDDWWTPIEIVRSLGDFNLDPCGNKSHPTAHRIFQLPNQDGLTEPWNGRVWLNPPYAQVGLWLMRLAAHGRGIALVMARTDTIWAQTYLPMADSVFFRKGRICFLKNGTPATGNAGAPSMFLAFGEKPKWNMEGWQAK